MAMGLAIRRPSIYYVALGLLRPSHGREQFFLTRSVSWRPRDDGAPHAAAAAAAWLPPRPAHKAIVSRPAGGGGGVPLPGAAADAQGRLGQGALGPLPYRTPSPDLRADRVRQPPAARRDVAVRADAGGHPTGARCGESMTWLRWLLGRRQSAASASTSSSRGACRGMRRWAVPGASSATSRRSRSAVATSGAGPRS